MNGTQTQAMPHEHGRERDISQKVGTGTSVLESFAGIAVIALGIVGLAGVYPAMLASIATILLGAGVLIEGGSFAALSEHFSKSSEERYPVQGQSLGVDFMAGVAAVVLGILALLGVYAPVLTSVAIIVLGAAFMFTGQVGFGLGGIVLGILAVVGLATVPLVLIGLLTLGTAGLFGGANLASRSMKEY